MKRLIIIGNGFDLAHDLHTRFDNFVESNAIYVEKYAHFKNRDNNWNDVEDKFKELVSEKLFEIQEEVDVEEIVEDIINSYGINKHGEVDHYDYKSEAFKEEVQKIDPFVYSLVSFEADFFEPVKKSL